MQQFKSLKQPPQPPMPPAAPTHTHTHKPLVPPLRPLGSHLPPLLLPESPASLNTCMAVLKLSSLKSPWMNQQFFSKDLKKMHFMDVTLKTHLLWPKPSDYKQHFPPYVLIDHKVETITPCWKDVMLQWSGTVVCVHHMTGLEDMRQKQLC